MTRDNLRSRRRALGLSQTKLAIQLGIDPQTVARYEQGRNRIPPYLDLALRELERMLKEHLLPRS